MLPYFQLGPVEFNSFAIMRLYAVVAMAYLFWIQWRADPDLGHRRWIAAGFVIAITTVVGAVGSKTWAILRPAVLDPFVSDPLLLALGSRWIFVGMIFALLGATVALKLVPVSVLNGLDFLAPGIALGHAIHRLGCFLSGDGCYGPATDLLWGVAFPRGTVPTSVPVHPTMLYEALWMLGVFTLLWTTKHRGLEGSTFALFVVLTATGCFLIQFLFLTPSLAWGLTEAQLQSLILMPLGLVKLLSPRGCAHKKV